jgi:hypothetical protein
MDRISTSTKAVDLFGAGKHGFKDGNLALGISPTDFNAAFFNDLQEEPLTIIEIAGIAPTAGQRDQMAKAIQSGKLFSASAGGTADAITATFTPGVSTLTNGMALFVRAAAANATTTPTFTPASGTIAAKAIVKGAGAALAAGDIAGAGHWIELQYDLTLDKWVLMNPATGVTSATTVSVQGIFKNLQASATGINATVSVSYDELVLGDGAGSYLIDRNAAGAINTATTGAGGLDTGVLAASTWYSVWRIGKADGTRSWLISLSATAPTMPAGYTHKARVGWIRTDGSANKYPLSFKQFGRKVRYVVAGGTNVTGLPLMVSGAQGDPSGPTWVAFSISNFVPPTASVLTLALWQHTTNIAVAAPNNSYGAVGSTTNPPPLANTMGGNNGGAQADFVIESTNMYYMSNAATGGAQCVGWDDNL